MDKQQEYKLFEAIAGTVGADKVLQMMDDAAQEFVMTKLQEGKHVMSDEYSALVYMRYYFYKQFDEIKRNNQHNPLKK